MKRTAEIFLPHSTKRLTPLIVPAGPQSVVTTETRNLLKAARELLGERRYQVARLAYGYDKTVAQIARRLHISKRMVNRHLREVDRICGQTRARAGRTRTLPLRETDGQTEAEDFADAYRFN